MIRMAIAFVLVAVSYVLPWRVAECVLKAAARVAGVIEKKRPIHFV